MRNEVTFGFDTFYQEDIFSEEFYSEIRFLETSNETNSNSRLYWLSIYDDQYIFLAVNIKNDKGLSEYGIPRERLRSDWKPTDYTEFLKLKKIS